MSEEKRVELSGEVLDNVSGGVILNPDAVINSATGQRYAWLSPNPDRIAAFGFVCGLGDVTEDEKIAALQAAGYIGGEIGSTSSSASIIIG